MQQFETKDSGNRTTFASGMQRDTTDGKVDYLLVRDGPMFKRWAALLQRGAVKYDPRNWMKARGEAEEERFRQSAARHFEQWLDGDTDEDHAAAVIFNLNGAEYVKDRRERNWARLQRLVKTSPGEILCAPSVFNDEEPRAVYGPDATVMYVNYMKPGAATEAEPTQCCGRGGCGGCA